MAILRGQEAINWIKNNPDKSFRDLSTGAVATPIKQRSAIENFLLGLTKPLRAGLTAANPLRQAQLYNPERLFMTEEEKAQAAQDFNSLLLTAEEDKDMYENPILNTIKAAAGIASYAVPVGAAAGAVGTGAKIGSAALRGAGAGALGGFGASKTGKELQGVLTGGLIGGAAGGVLQGAGEAINRFASGKAGKAGMSLDNIKTVRDVANLPDDIRTPLRDLAETAGFRNPKLSESQNILNYLKNQNLAGSTAKETLENMTQGAYDASKLKRAGLDEISGISRGYLKQAEDSFNKAIKYRGMTLDDAGKAIKNDILQTLRKGPQDAKSLDDIANRWYEAGLTARGEQKMSAAGLYKEGAKAIRDVLRSTPKSQNYDQGLKALRQILGVEDEGLVAKAAAQSDKTGINIPLFQNSGVYGADIKTPFISEVLSKAKSGIAKNRLDRSLGTQAPQADLTSLLDVIGILQRGIPAGASFAAQAQVDPSLTPVQEVLNPQVSVQSQSGINKEAIIQDVLNGTLSTSDAKFIIDMLEPQQSQVKLTEKQKQFMAASQTAGEALTLLESGAANTGKLQNIGGAIGRFFGSQSPAQTEYLSKLDGARMAAISALSGANVPPSEYERMRNLIPEPTDEYDIAIQKLRSFQSVMNNYAQSGGGAGNDMTNLLQMIGL